MTDSAHPCPPEAITHQCFRCPACGASIVPADGACKSCGKTLSSIDWIGGYHRGRTVSGVLSDRPKDGTPHPCPCGRGSMIPTNRHAKRSENIFAQMRVEVFETARSDGGTSMQVRWHSEADGALYCSACGAICQGACGVGGQPCISGSTRDAKAQVKRGVRGGKSVRVAQPSDQGISGTDEGLSNTRREGLRSSRSLVIGGKCRKGLHTLTRRNLYVSPKGMARCEDCRKQRQRTGVRGFGPASGSALA